MIVLTIRKILLISAGIVLLIAGLMGMILPIIPGFVLGIVGIMLFAKAAGEHREKEMRDRLQRLANALKIRLAGARLAAKKITAIFF